MDQDPSSLSGTAPGHDQAQPLPDSSASERRGVERRTVDLEGVLLHEGGKEQCRVFDISPQGALVSASDKVAVNRPVRLRVTASGEFLGAVAWRRGDRMGLRFVQFGEDGILEGASERRPLRLVSRKQV